MTQPATVPARAWVVTAAGMAVNLCLGILYAWSIWKGVLVPKPADKHLYGTEMSGINAGWRYLSDSQGTVAYSVCGLTFALCMIPAGRLQDRYGAKIGATLGGLCLAAGCILAGVMKSYTGLVIGFGILGGIGMGLGYAAATPAAVKWFHSSRRGLIVGLVVAGYGAAAIYIAPLADYLIGAYGLTGSFVGLGILFAVVVVVAGLMLNPPPPGYVAPIPQHIADGPKVVTTDVPARRMLRTWQFYLLVFLFIGSAQSGLLVIANAKSLLEGAAGPTGFFAANAWVLAAFGGFVNAAGRVGTGRYSDRIGRLNAYALNGVISAACLFAAPWVIGQQNVLFLFVIIGVMFWQYGGTLAVMPAITADYFGPKNLGLNYGLVFVGWGIAFFVPLLAGYIKDATGNLDTAFYLSGGMLVAAVLASRVMRKPNPA